MWFWTCLREVTNKYFASLTAAKKLDFPQGAGLAATKSFLPSDHHGASAWTRRPFGESRSLFQTGCPCSTPKCLFQTARLVHLVFGRGMSFFQPRAFCQPRNEAQKRAQSFFQPLCIILSLFSAPRNILWRTPDLFFEPQTSFSGSLVLFSTSAREKHTQGKMRSKSQSRNLASLFSDPGTSFSQPHALFSVETLFL